MKMSARSKLSALLCKQPCRPATTALASSVTKPAVIGYTVAVPDTTSPLLAAVIRDGSVALLVAFTHIGTVWRPLKSENKSA